MQTPEDISFFCGISCFSEWGIYQLLDRYIFFFSLRLVEVSSPGNA